MKRATIASGLLAAALATSCFFTGGRRGGATYPGAPVVLISIDTLRADHLPAYGYRDVDTPHIDALRKDAILFENAYSPVPLTLPSHVSMLTGLLPPAHQVRDNLGYTLDAKAHPTLATVLKARGYATGAAISAYVLRGRTGIGAGFDLYEDAIEVPQATDAAGQARRPGAETARLAVQWLETVKGKPFLLFFHIYEPHSPYEPAEPFKSRYRLPYDGTIAEADAIVGDVVAALRRMELYDRAIVILLSDHGEGLGDHGEEFHGILLYREALHVPLLLKLPGGAQGGTSVRPPVALIDLFPTLAGLLGVTAPPGLPGRSLLEANGGEKSALGVYGETYYPRIHLGWSDLRSLIDGRYQLIDGPNPELYDILRDPGETTNLVASHAQVRDAMKRALAAHATGFSAPSRMAPEDLEKLRALGYLSGTTPTDPGAPLPDPRQSIHVLTEVKAAFRLVAEKRDAAAAAAFQEILRVNPRFFDVRYALGETLTRLGRWEEAARIFRAAMQDAPSFTAPLALALGRVCVLLDELDEAAANGRRAMPESPAEAHEILARVALARGDLATAEREVALVEGSVGAELSGALILAEVRIRRSQLPEAMATLEAARARIASEKLRPVQNLSFLYGDVLARLGRNADAESAFQEEIRLFPDNADAYARLAIVWAMERRTVAEVHGLLEKMYRAAPVPKTALLAARTLDSIGDRPGAVSWRRRAGAAASRAGR